MKKKISFVIPVYRNEGSLIPTFTKVTELFTGARSIYELEFIFVNDGSDDASMDDLLFLKTHNKGIKIISFSRNFGQLAALVAGCKEVTGQGVVMMSADLQDPPELILDMIDEWNNGSEVIIGHRIDREDNFIVNATSRVFYGLMKLSNSKVPSGGFDFVFLDQKALHEFNLIDERNRFFQGDILWLGFRLKFIPYKRLKRTIGKSQWTLTKKLKYFIDGLLNMSYAPIRMMSFLGLITAFFGFVYAIQIVYLRLMHQTPFNGWAPIMILILIIGGLIMLMLGIIGEYIWRTYDETRNRPLYIIKDKLVD
jgi:polyisoprenyl-phosphate glycosyltransferase